ncbi:MAG: hypothetical protein JWL96_4333 [Sphingomonas bacterium]|uniref:hypothetical protein n=1 Tax=Sphingomonas bacterium TaxID=1895847 RepID=UPI002621569D|nr:hypothetical protein [Sphingomonas bacterium]MDB5712263.1 hypothetical protein [Sphingomonas bacterium]
MNRIRGLAVLALPLALLAACHGARQPGATTAGEDKQLDEAAAMLDANSMEVNAVDMNSVDQGDDSDGNSQ